MSESIRKLPRQLINQIAAGEVIERPASVVKELVENSLDAGARHVEVELGAGGRSLIVVRDDGRGIPADQLPLSLSSHATSKIVAADDLLDVATYGFRGEALASIASIAHVQITSRSASEEVGAVIVSRGGEFESVRPVARPAGTSIEVRDLFYNTPARRKFMKTDATETGHALEAVLRLALARTDVAFAVETSGRRSLKLDGDETLRERIASGYGRELAASLLEVEGGAIGIEVHGLIAPPSQARARARLNHLFVNGRYVRDRAVQGAVRRAFSDFMPDSLAPIYFLFLNVEPREVDCNVHPTKTEVRLRNSSDVFRVVMACVNRALRDADLTPRFRSPGYASGAGAPAAGFTATVAERATELGSPGSTPVLFGSARHTLEGPGPSADATAFQDALRAPGEAVEPSQPPAVRERAIPGRHLQILNTYIACATEEGLLLLDQHALHERVLYRHLREEWQARKVRSQNLLTPERVELSAAQVAVLEESAELLETVGIRLARFGDNEVAVSAVPATGGQRDLAALVRRVADFLEGERPEGRLDDFADRMLFTMACHKAVRAGDSLNQDQIEALLEEADRIEHSHTCPHGRPTRVIIPAAELENLFKRRGF